MLFSKGLKFSLIVGGCLGFFAISIAESMEDEAERLLARVQEMTPKQKFAAVRKIIIWDPSGMNKIYEDRIIQVGTRARIEYPDSSPFAGQIVVENDGKRQTYFVSKNEIREIMIRPMKEQIELFRDRGGRFSFAVEDGGKIASYSTRLITVNSGDRLRQRIWVEPKKYLVLKREVYDSNRKLVGGLEIQRISFDPKISRSTFELPKNAKVIKPKDDLIRIAKELKVKPFTLPSSSGYELMMVRGGEMFGRQVLRQIFESPKGHVSLLQVVGAKPDDLKSPEGRGGKGRPRMYAWNEGNATLVLVGEVDDSTLRRLAELVKVEQQ